MFKISKECDFEWHIDDGEHCPTCNPSKQAENKSGVFGSGQKSTRWSNWFKAIGFIALVYFIYGLFRR